MKREWLTVMTAPVGTCHVPDRHSSDYSLAGAPLHLLLTAEETTRTIARVLQSRWALGRIKCTDPGGRQLKMVGPQAPVAGSQMVHYALWFTVRIRHT